MTARDLGKMQAALMFAAALGAILAMGMMSIGQSLSAFIMIAGFVIVGIARIVTLPPKAA